MDLVFVRVVVISHFPFKILLVKGFRSTGCIGIHPNMYLTIMNFNHNHAASLQNCHGNDGDQFCLLLQQHFLPFGGHFL